MTEDRRAALNDHGDNGDPYRTRHYLSYTVKDDQPFTVASKWRLSTHSGVLAGGQLVPPTLRSANRQRLLVMTYLIKVNQLSCRTIK